MHVIKVDVVGNGPSEEVWLVISFWTELIFNGQIAFAGSRTAHASSVCAWVTVGDVDGLILAVFSDSDLVLGAGLELKYALTEKWELAASAEYNHTDFLEEEIYQLRADYHLSPRITLGGFYTHRSGDFETVKISGSATTNEGGVSLRFLF